MNCIYEKHLGWKMRDGRKLYRALVVYNGQRRVSRKVFAKASQAALYGRRWATRVNIISSQSEPHDIEN